MKRLIIATILGIIAGFICCKLASSGGEELAPALRANIISGRAMIGIAIGLNKFNMKHWAISGLVLGLIFSIPSGFGAMLANNSEYSTTQLFFMTVFMGMIYGLLIELITTVLFKAKM